MQNYDKYLNKGIEKIQLIGMENVSDISYMFSGCLSLISLPNISKISLKNIINMSEIFFIAHHYQP